MTNPGEDAGQTPASDSRCGASEPSSGGYEAPPIEQSSSRDSPGNPRSTSRPAPSSRAYHPAPGVHPAVAGVRHAAELSADQQGYPPPGYPPADYTPPTEYPSARARNPATRRRPTRGPPGYGAPSYPAAAAIRTPQYGTPPPPATGRRRPAIRHPNTRRYGQPAQKTNQMAIGSLVASLRRRSVRHRFDRRHRARHRRA